MHNKIRPQPHEKHAKILYYHFTWSQIEQNQIPCQAEFWQKQFPQIAESFASAPPLTH